MRSSRSIIAVITLVLFTTLSACDRPDPDSERNTDRNSERSSRQEREARDDQSNSQSSSDANPQIRTVENFDSIEIRGAAELIVNVGPAAALTIDANSRRLKHVDSHVAGHTLIIDVAKAGSWFSDHGHLKITVATPELKSLESNGAGEISIHGLNGGEQLLRLAGAHDVKADGHLDKLIVELSGAGNVDYNKVEVADAKVTVNGAGNVEVHIKDALHAEVNGLGAVRYSGNPQKVESELHGLGSISHL